MLLCLVYRISASHGAGAALKDFTERMRTKATHEATFQIFSDVIAELCLRDCLFT